MIHMSDAASSPIHRKLFEWKRASGDHHVL